MFQLRGFQSFGKEKTIDIFSVLRQTFNENLKLPLLIVKVQDYIFRGDLKVV